MLIGLVLALPLLFTVAVLYGLRRTGRITPRTERRVYAYAFLGTIALASLFMVYDANRTFNAMYGGAAGQVAEGDVPTSYAQYFGATCKAHAMTIVDAGAHWCGHCKDMDEVTFADPSVKVAIANDGFVHVYEESDPQVIVALEVEGYPTTIFLDRQCKEVHRARGFRPPEKFLDEVRTARGKLPAQ
jgi:thiol:disulfide interchange protein